MSIGVLPPRPEGDGAWSYTMAVASTLELLVIGDLTCRLIDAGPVCEHVRHFDNAGARLLPPKVYRSPMGFFGDSRFKLIADDGTTLEGFRLGYN